MDMKRVCALSFSPTGGTERVARFLAEALARRLGVEVHTVDFTRPEERQREWRFASDELVVVATPVYAGRVPNKILPDFQARVLGSGQTPAVPLCVFGNRSVDEGLQELALLLEGNGFQLAAAGAFVSRHVFSDRLAVGRPDDTDWAELEAFAARAAEKLEGVSLPPLELDRGEVGPYYTPLKEDGTPARFLKAKPKTDSGKCTHCGVCAAACPMGSIDGVSMEAVGLCIKCHACVRRCPAGAKFFDDPDLRSHLVMLEEHFARRAENVTFL